MMIRFIYDDHVVEIMIIMLMPYPMELKTKVNLEDWAEQVGDDMAECVEEW